MSGMTILRALHEARYTLETAQEEALRHGRTDVAAHLERAVGCIDSAVDELRAKSEL